MEPHLRMWVYSTRIQYLQLTLYVQRKKGFSPKKSCRQHRDGECRKSVKLEEYRIIINVAENGHIYRGFW